MRRFSKLAQGSFMPKLYATVWDTGPEKCDLLGLFQLLSRDALKVHQVLKFYCNSEHRQDPPSKLSLSYKKSWEPRASTVQGSPRDHETQVCEDFLSTAGSTSTRSSPAHAPASSGPATNCFPHFLLHSWSTSKTLPQSFCLHMAHYGLTSVLSASASTDILFFQYFSIQSSRKESSPDHLFIYAVP